MLVNDQVAYDAYVELNSHDGYSKAVVDYSERWANLMEQALPNYSSVDEMIKEQADALSHVADTDGITGFMYGCAVKGLATYWVHGENLRKWHNKEYGVENSTGVVNPAILTIEITPKE